MQQVAAADQNCAAFAPCVRRQQSQHCAGQCAFSATGLAEYADDLSRANRQAEAIHGADGVAVFGRVGDRQFPDLSLIHI